MTHDELIQVGIKWLKRPYRNCDTSGHSACSVVLAELVTHAQEIPDVIGFAGHKTIVLEAKASISDFRADAKKPWRQVDFMGMGALRYFICEDGLIPLVEVPEKWGLLYVLGNKVKVVKDAHVFDERQWRNEIMMLLSHIRRITTASTCLTPTVSAG